MEKNPDSFVLPLKNDNCWYELTQRSLLLRPHWPDTRNNITTVYRLRWLGTHELRTHTTTTFFILAPLASYMGRNHDGFIFFFSRRNL